MVSSEEKIHVKTPEYVSLQFQPSGLGSRSVAFIIDQLIIMTANLIIMLTVIFGMEGFAAFFEAFGSPMIPVAIAIVVVFAINWGYFFVLEYFTGGRTIGKKAAGIRVIQDNGHSITLLGSFIRNLVRIVDMLPASYLIGIIMIFLHSEHKRLGDLAAGTVVVHEKNGKKSKSRSRFEQELDARHITKEDLPIEDWVLNSFGTKEWQLLKRYTDRFTRMPVNERASLTTDLAKILLVKADINIEGKGNDELENMLLALYLRLKEDYEYEL